ncbi:hypothetical protein GGI08_000875, partial [Coemansia sp. S2]
RSIGPGYFEADQIPELALPRQVQMHKSIKLTIAATTEVEASGGGDGGDGGGNTTQH